LLYSLFLFTTKQKDCGETARNIVICASRESPRETKKTLQSQDDLEGIDGFLQNKFGT
jgi:hypothetical protein